METLVRAISDLLAAILARFGYVGRARRRNNIQEDLGLLERLRDLPESNLSDTAHRYLSQHIELEVAHFAGVELKGKKVIPWGAVVIALGIGLPFGYLTYTIVKDGFAWYAIPPGIVAGLMLIAAIGLVVQGDPDDQDASSERDAAPAVDGA